MSLDLSEREVATAHCDGCGRDYDKFVVFATRDGDAYAVVGGACHGHGDHEVWLDVTFGSWEEPYDDHVTMSCCVMREGSGAVDAVVVGKGEADCFGRKLTREETLAHPRVDELWALGDAIKREVPEARRALYGEA